MMSARIHIIDDDEAVRFAITMLVDACGWKAQSYASAEEFLGTPIAERSDGCLVLDLNMPGMTGAEFLERAAVELPVIVITGHAGSGLAERAERAGARAVLKKPFNDELLIGHIKQALGVAR